MAYHNGKEEWSAHHLFQKWYPTFTTFKVLDIFFWGGGGDNNRDNGGTQD